MQSVHAELRCAHGNPPFGIARLTKSLKNSMIDHKIYESLICCSGATVKTFLGWLSQLFWPPKPAGDPIAKFWAVGRMAPCSFEEEPYRISSPRTAPYSTPFVGVTQVSYHAGILFGIAGRAGLHRLRKNAPRRTTTSALGARPLPNQEGSCLKCSPPQMRRGGPPSAGVVLN